MSIDVSVIIPTYNRELLLDEALNSIYSQQYDGEIEIIVVDDHSQDKTVDIIKSNHPHVHLISLNQNVGNYAARNQALVVAQGKYIAFLDSDDLWKPNYLEVQINSLEQYERCFAVSGLEVWDVAKNERYHRTQTPDLDKFISPLHQLLIFGNNFIWTPSSVVFPRYILDDVGFFDETYRMGGDLDLYLRCLGKGYDFCNTMIPNVIWRCGTSHQLTSSKNLRKREETFFYCVRKFYGSDHINSCYTTPSIRNVLIDSCVNYAWCYFSANNTLDAVRSCIAAALLGAPLRALHTLLFGLTQPLRLYFKQIGRIKLKA